MSRQARMERIVSARVGTNIYQGCVINPQTGMSSVPKRDVSDIGSIIDEHSDNNEKSSIEDNTDIVIGETKKEIDSDEIAAEYEQLKRPEERRSKRNPELADNHVSDWVNDPNGDPFKARTYLPAQDYPIDQKSSKESILHEKKSSLIKEKDPSTHETKQRKRKTGKKVIKSKREKNANKKQDKSDFDDNDEVVAGHQHLISEMKSMTGDQNYRCKSLLGELDTFLRSHESTLVNRGEKLNLEPSNVNMNEFNNWLDNVEKGTVENNETKYKTEHTGSSNVKKPLKVKQKKKKANKQAEISPMSTIQATSDYNSCLPKQAWNGEIDDSFQISFEEPVEVLDEKVLNSWRSTPVLHKEKETKVIRVMADKKHLGHDSTNILLDVE